MHSYDTTLLQRIGESVFPFRGKLSNPCLLPAKQGTTRASHGEQLCCFLPCEARKKTWCYFPLLWRSVSQMVLAECLIFYVFYIENIKFSILELWVNALVKQKKDVTKTKSHEEKLLDSWISSRKTE